jgi:hypothetical protein
MRSITNIFTFIFVLTWYVFAAVKIAAEGFGDGNVTADNGDSNRYTSENKNRRNPHKTNGRKKSNRYRFALFFSHQFPAGFALFSL